MDERRQSRSRSSSSSRRESWLELPEKSLSIEGDLSQLSLSATSPGNIQLDTNQPDNDQDGDFQIPLQQQAASEKMNWMNEELAAKFDGAKSHADVNYAVSSKHNQKCQLDLQAMTDIEKLYKELGPFTYYVLPNMKVVVHIEDDTAKDKAESIKDCIGQIARRCNPNDDIELMVVERSFEAELCGIGDTLEVDDKRQTIGMYMQYDGIVYWVSAAHNVVPDNKEESTNYLCEVTDRMHRADRGTRKVCLVEGTENLGGFSDPRLIRSPTPYVCFSLNRVPGVSGRELKHYVDIMIGPVPVQASHAEAGVSCWDSRSMHTVCPPCSCGMDGCTNPGHMPVSCDYAITEVLKLEPIADGSCAYYDGSGLVDEVLHCRPQQQNSVAGRVAAFQNYIDVRRLGDRDHRFHLENVLMIVPTGRVLPQVGDSGSVWVLRGKGQAVAITVGRGKMVERQGSRSRVVWLAALLHPSLDAFCAAHPTLFPEVDGFKPIKPQPSTEFTDPNTSVRSLTGDSGFVTRGAMPTSQLLPSVRQ